MEYYAAMVQGAILRAARGFLDWSRGECAEAAGISEDTVKNIEIGKFRPNADTNQKLINASASHGLTLEHDGIKKIPHCPHCNGVIY